MKTRKPSYTLNLKDAVEVWLLHMDGMFQNRIAAKFDVNPGRVNEVLKGKRFPEAYGLAMKRQRDAA